MAEQIGRYWVHDPVATGGMATVHLARMLGPLGFARTVAVKRLHKHLATDAEFTVMLLDEARISARIQHPAVVQTLDVVSVDGELLIVMEYVHGESLARLIKRTRERGEKTDPAIAAAILVSVLRGLHAAHEAIDEKGDPLHVVHRDVSPQNVLVDVDGAAKVLDFGVAKALGRAQTTHQGQLKGKFAYMSPEQLQGGAVDRRTDVFAASIVLWELLTGARLFAAEDEKTIVGKVLHAPIPPPSAVRAEISPAIDEVVLRGLERDADARWPTAQAMARALEAAIPIATPSKVAAWVDSLFRDELSARRRRIADLERSGASQPSAALQPTSSTAVEQTKSAQSVSLPVAAKPALGRRWPFVVAPLAIAAAIFIWLQAHPRSEPGASTAASATTLALPTPSVTPPVVASGASTSDTTATTPSTSTTSSSAAPVAPPPEPPRPKIKPSTAKTAAPPKVDCTNPYTLDAQGHKRYRRECLKP